MAHHGQHLDGPRLAPANGNAAASLVILLHGYGANGDDLIGLGRRWADTLPSTAFVAPHAPEPIPFPHVPGRQWFALTFQDPAEVNRGALAAAPGLQSFIDAELAKHDLSSDRLAIVGFSQGTILALEVAYRRADAPAAVLGYSGLLARGGALASEGTVRPPALLIHGEEDGVVPAECSTQAAEALTSHGVTATAILRPGLGHGLDDEGIAAGGAFLAEHLAG